MNSTTASSKPSEIQKARRLPIQGLGRGLIPPDVNHRPQSIFSWYTNLLCWLLTSTCQSAYYLFSVRLSAMIIPISHHLRSVSAQSLFFQRQLTLSQRITHVAATLTSMSASSQKRKAKHQVGSVMDLIDKAVEPF
jgi:hypothetical protein